MVDARVIQERADPRLCRSHEIRCTDCGAEFYIDLAGLGAETAVQCPGCGDTGAFSAEQIETFRADWLAAINALENEIRTADVLPEALVVPQLGHA